MTFSRIFRRVLPVIAASALVRSAGAAERPNIILIFSDDHAAQAVSAYGSGLNQTPNIDRIAKEGIRFDRCYVTNALCGPSRACVMTGKYSHRNGFATNRSSFDGSQQTFPKLLQQAGYQTAVIGKWHLVTEPTGFDHWQILPGQGRYYSPQFNTSEGQITEPGYVSDVITEKSLAWLREGRQPDQPFFLMVGHKAPHREWEASPAHVGDLAGKKIAEPPTLFDDYEGRADAARSATMRVADLRLEQDLKLYAPESASGQQFFARMSDKEKAAWLAAYTAENDAFNSDPPEGEELVRWKYQRYIKDYLRTVQSVDDSVGRLLAYLDESGLAENTIVVYSSDNGFFLGEHGWFDKRFMYEESMRVPLVVRWPGVAQAGGVESRIVSNVDFAETFLEAAGVEIPSDMQGRSFGPLLRGKAPDDWRTSFYYHYYEGPPAEHTVREHYGVTDGRYKLIHYYTIDQWELFDLQSDPQELASVYGQPDYAAPRARMEEELARLREQLGVTTNDPPPSAGEPRGGRLRPRQGLRERRQANRAARQRGDR